MLPTIVKRFMRGEGGEVMCQFVQHHMEFFMHFGGPKNAISHIPVGERQTASPFSNSYNIEHHSLDKTLKLTQFPGCHQIVMATLVLRLKG